MARVGSVDGGRSRHVEKNVEHGSSPPGGVRITGLATAREPGAERALDDAGITIPFPQRTLWLGEPLKVTHTAPEPNDPEEETSGDADGGSIISISSLTAHNPSVGLAAYAGSKKALEYITGHDDVWLATGREIAAHYYEHHYDDALAHIERLRAEEAGR